MAFYRKKPVIVEAMQWTGGAEAATPVINWILASGGTVRYHEAEPSTAGHLGGFEGAPEHLAIDTLEAVMRAEPGDWIIRGVKGEHYPCKPDIFEATYEPTDGASA